jgi:hypothetical protein
MKLPAKHAKIIGDAILAAQVDYQLYYDFSDKGNEESAELFKKAHARAIETLRGYGIDAGRTIYEIESDLTKELTKGYETATIE